MATEQAGGADTELAYIPDHEELAWRRLLSQDQTKPRLVALLKAFGTVVQDAEDTLFDVLISRVLDDSTGAVLDRWGAIVGERRDGLGDEDYRRFVKARILVNIGDSTIDELIVIWQIITGPSHHVRYMPMHPAGYHMHVVRRSFMAETVRARVRRMMEQARPAGVTSEMVEAIVGYLGYEDDPYAVPPDAGLLARIL